MKTTRTGLLAGSAMLALIAPVATWMSGAIAGATAVAWLTSGTALADGGAGGDGLDSSLNLLPGGASGTASSPDGGDGPNSTFGGGGGGGAAGGGTGGAGGGGTAGGTTPGQNGSDATSSRGGGGGGAGGADGLDSSGTLDASTGALTGGNGGNGGNGNGIDGGAGGGGGEGGYGALVAAGGMSTNSAAVTGGDGGKGGDSYAGFDPFEYVLGTDGSGGDGGIGIQFNGANTSFTNEAGGSVTGGNGGNTGNGSTYSTSGIAAAGIGGNGGSGLQITTTGATVSNAGSVTGGNGGDGGINVYVGGQGGDGGSGMSFTVGGANITNTGSIAGGNGGVGGRYIGTGQSGITGADGAGGEGINGSDLNITNDGSITGGLGGDGVTRADAIHFTGGTNKLTLESNSVINGNVVSDGGASSTLALGGSNDGSFDLSQIGGSGQYQGFTTYEKTGSSTWLVTGTTTTDWTIEDGTLEVGDSAGTTDAINGAVSVQNGGTLAGYGNVASLTNDGTVAPGGLGTSDFGTLTVNGDYTQNSDGSLRIIVTPGGASKLMVTGTATLDGNLKLAFAPGVYNANSYAIVTAANGINGDFSTVTNTNAPAVDITTEMGSNDLQLLLSNQSSGGGTTTVAPTDGHVAGATTTSLVSSTQLATQSLFDHLSDQRFGADNDALHTAFAGSNPAQVAFAGDMAALNDIVACLPEALARNGGWFRGLGGFGNINSTNGAPGIDSYGGGFMAGYDRALTDNFLLGIAAGYTRTQINGDDNSNASIDTPRVSLYGSYHLGGFSLDSSVGYAFDHIKSQDQSDGGTARAKHDANEINAALQASYNVKLPSAFVLTPHAGVDYLHIFEQGYNEHGAGAFDLQAESNNTDSLRPQVGAGISRSFATDNGWSLIPELDLTYSREMLDNKHDANVVAGGGSFTVKGLAQTRDQLALSLGLTAQMTDNVDLSLGYTQILPVGNTTSYNFTGGVRVLF